MYLVATITKGFLKYCVNSKAIVKKTVSYRIRENICIFLVERITIRGYLCFDLIEILSIGNYIHNAFRGILRVIVKQLNSRKTTTIRPTIR